MLLRLTHRDFYSLSRCAKCGTLCGNPKLHVGDGCGDQLIVHPGIEHLHFYCNCGYNWTKKTLEQLENLQTNPVPPPIPPQHIDPGMKWPQLNLFLRIKKFFARPKPVCAKRGDTNAPLSVKIPAFRTAQEIGTLLAESGATAVLTEYDKDKKIKALSFKLEVKGSQVPFMLPARIEPVFLYLQRKKSPRNRTKKSENDLQQAERVAWRQLLRWIQAQLSMIDTGMVAAEEVFFPYIQTAPDQTLFERMTSSGRLALPPAEE